MGSVRCERRRAGDCSCNLLCKVKAHHHDPEVIQAIRESGLQRPAPRYTARRRTYCNMKPRVRSSLAALDADTATWLMMRTEPKPIVGRIRSCQAEVELKHVEQPLQGEAAVSSPNRLSRRLVRKISQHRSMAAPSDSATSAVLQALHTLYSDPDTSSKRAANDWLQDFQHSVGCTGEGDTRAASQGYWRREGAEYSSLIGRRLADMSFVVDRARLTA